MDLLSSQSMLLEQAEPNFAGTASLVNVVRSPRFAVAGIASGSTRNFKWTVVDPVKHPLRAWGRDKNGITAYSRTAAGLGAALFTNGPLMGKCVGSRKLSRSNAPWELGKCVGMAGLVGLLAGRAVRSPFALGAAGAVLGSAYGAKRIFTDWVPCGGVRSVHYGIDDRRNFDNEGDTHAWFGRFANEFNSYGIADGDLPSNVHEGMGGLIALIRDFTPVNHTSNERASVSHLTKYGHKKGVIAWGLIPLDFGTRGQRNDGVLVVLGSERHDLHDAVRELAALGTRDAIATDQRGMIMLGVYSKWIIGPPRLYRQAMQHYGLGCF